MGKNICKKKGTRERPRGVCKNIAGEGESQTPSSSKSNKCDAYSGRSTGPAIPRDAPDDQAAVAHDPAEGGPDAVVGEVHVVEVQVLAVAPDLLELDGVAVRGVLEGFEGVGGAGGHEVDVCSVLVYLGGFAGAAGRQDGHADLQLDRQGGQAVAIVRRCLAFRTRCRAVAAVVGRKRRELRSMERRCRCEACDS